MADSIRALRIHPGRMAAAFDQLAAIGATHDGGVDRPAFSEPHRAARRWFRQQVREAGLEFREDGAGNHSAVLRCEDAAAPTLLIGSHLDSVPHGGRFDGALGVVAGLEILLRVRESGLPLPMHLEAIDFTDEEGTFVGLLGSTALCGQLDPRSLEHPRSGRAAFLDGLSRAGLTERGLWNAARPPGSLAAYLELHVEQGRRLEESGIDIGIVPAIAGIRSMRFGFIGRADHAGSTRMGERLDASLGASAFTLEARRLVLDHFPECVVNVGRMDFSPGAFNIVPGRVVLACEFRSPYQGQLHELEAAVRSTAESQAGRFGLTLQVEPCGGHPPAEMDPGLQQDLARACGDLGLSHASLPSGAIHDGQALSRVTRAGMIFVPSVDGASHSPRERTEWEDCVNGANVLLRTVCRLAAPGE